MTQIAMGLEYLHTELNVTHRCLKPENILVFQGDLLKITDYGMTKEHDASLIA